MVFHAGANVAQRWGDFQQYSAADQEYFDQLLPIEGLEFANAEELEVEPLLQRYGEGLEVRGQTGVHIQEIPLIQDDPEALKALRLLQERGYTSEQVRQALEELEPVPTTRVRERQAMRAGLDMRVRTEAARILNERRTNPEGSELDRQRLGRTNLIIMKAAIDRHVDAAVGHRTGERHEFTRSEFEHIDLEFDDILERAVQEVFNATA